MEQLQYDPRTKAQIQQALYEFLYDPVEKQFKTRLDTIIIRNTILGGHSHKSFNYKGEFYTCDNTPANRVWNRLHPSLRQQMDDYLKDKSDITEKEMPLVIGFVNRVLNASNNLNDYLRLFPDSVHYPIENLIASCPCHNKALPQEKVDLLVAENKAPIDMMRARMVTNLLI